MISTLLALTVIVSMAFGSITASAEQVRSDGSSVATSAAKKKKKKKAAKKKARCSKKAIKKLKGKAKKKRIKACKKAKKKKKPAPGTPGAAGLAPKDYGKNQLSERKYTEMVTENFMLPMADGRSVYVEVYRPKAEGQFPVIFEASPYHGTLYNREGWRILPQPAKADKDEPQGLVHYFVPRGYAVVMMDLRGTGKSQGCLDHLGPKDAVDLKAVTEWSASQPWSTGKVGMLGHSYVGSTPALAAAQNPKGLETVILSAGLASMYDHQYQHGVPWMLQYAGPVYGYQGLALDRALPPGFEDPATGAQTGDNFGNDPQEAACGATQNATISNEAMLSGRYDTWHAERDFREGIKNWPGKVWVVHGVNDDAARIASIQWFNERGIRSGDKFWLGQWDHGIGCCPTRRGLQWTLAVHAWFDKHLMGRNVDTGPAFEAFINDATTDAEAIDMQSEQILANEWPLSGAKGLELKATPDNKLADGAEDDTLTFTGDGSGFNNRYEGGLDFVTEPLAKDVVVAGVPKLDLAITQSSPRMHMVATIYQQTEDGGKRRISTCAMNPELREGIEKLTPVVPGTRMLVSPPCFTTAHRFKAGTQIGLKVNTSDPDHVPTFAAGVVQVHTGAEGTKVTLPVLESTSNVFNDTIDLEATGFAGSGA